MTIQSATTVVPELDVEPVDIEPVDVEPVDVEPPGEPSQLEPDELDHLHILRRVTHESVWGLLEHCPVRQLHPGDVLLAKGQGNQRMFLVLDGRLRVHLDAPDDDPVALIESGQAVGELSVLDDSPASAYVVAASDSRVLDVDEKTFWRMVAASHEFATNLLLLLAQRMRANNFTIEENARLRRRLEHDATVDALTGLRNRRWLDLSMVRMARRHCHAGDPLSVVMIDVDHFKRFNDTYGHAAGDAVLRSVAEVIVTELRPTDAAARFGGEEFIVILPNTPVGGAVAAANRLRLAIAATEVTADDGRRLPAVTISAGAAELGRDPDADEVIKRADAALYRAKHRGRNRVER